MGCDQNRCGDCAFCCRALSIPELGKGENLLCGHHVKGLGCGIWSTRPVACRRFVCLWYANPRFPDKLRPDRCGVMFEPVRAEDGPRPVMTANVSPERPDAWREGIASEFIMKCLAAGTSLVVIVGNEKHFILSEGANVQQVWRHVEDGARASGFVR